jgi:hypothetical protein
VALIRKAIKMIFWIPVAISAILLFLSWDEAKQPLFRLAWLAFALILQMADNKFSPLWVIGIILQTILAIYMLIWRKVMMR